MPTALIVDDEPAANKLLAMLIQLKGCRTDSAYTAGEALVKVDLEPPDVVFLDLMLPDQSGYEVCKALKSRKSTTLIPIVMVTARDEADNRTQSYVLGADQYVSKPYTPDQIFEAMNAAFEARRELDAQPFEGRISITPHDEGDAARRISRLRSVILARTALDAQAADRVGVALRKIASAAAELAERRNLAEPAVLCFHIDNETIAVELEDKLGWLRECTGSLAERWRAEVALAGFEEVVPAASTDSLTLIKRLV